MTGKADQLPWVHEKPQASKPPTGWGEYLLSHGPIPLQGPIRYVYDQLRAKGASAIDSTAIIKALIIGGVGYTGIPYLRGLRRGQGYSQAQRDSAEAEVPLKIPHFFTCLLYSLT